MSARRPADACARDSTASAYVDFVCGSCQNSGIWMPRTIWSVRVVMLRETCDSTLPPPSEVKLVTSVDFADTATSRIFARSARARLRASSWVSAWPRPTRYWLSGNLELLPFTQSGAVGVLAQANRTTVLAAMHSHGFMV